MKTKPTPTERTFVAELDLLGINLIQGRYKIEKKISLFEKGEGPGIKSNSPIARGHFLEVEFVIK